MITPEQRKKIWASATTDFRGGADLDTLRINDDGSVSFFENVTLHNKRLTKLPFPIASVGNNLWLDDSRLTTLEGCPDVMQGSLGIEGCLNLRNLKGAPSSCFEIMADNTRLTSLEGLPEEMSNMHLTWHADLGMLRLLMVRGMQTIAISHPNPDLPLVQPITDILQRYLNTGRAGVMPCAAELHKAGFGGNAKL